MEEISYYLEQAARARRLSAETAQAGIRERLARLAQQYDQLADDIQQGAVDVRHPELRQENGDKTRKR